MKREQYGRALWDYHRGEKDAALQVTGDLGEYDELPVRTFFRNPPDFSSFERIALEYCRGRVLDLGAGTGVHALALQAQGLPVTAVEIVPQAAEIMRQRGVEDVREVDLVRGGDWKCHVAKGEYDTLLMMMNGTGITATLAGLGLFLERAHWIVNRDGQILVDSEDLRSEEDRAGPPGAPVKEDGRYLGEVQIQLEYRGEKGQPFAELYVDPTTLAAIASETGWDTRILDTSDSGGYLARLTRSR